jgi:hypothetical protein
LVAVLAGPLAHYRLVAGYQLLAQMGVSHWAGSSSAKVTKAEGHGSGLVSQLAVQIRAHK